jgi:hypothetical protein
MKYKSSSGSTSQAAYKTCGESYEQCWAIYLGETIAIYHHFGQKVQIYPPNFSDLRKTMLQNESAKTNSKILMFNNSFR